MNTVFLDVQTFSPSISLASIEQAATKLTTYALTNTREQVIERCADAEIIITNKVIIDAHIIPYLKQLKLICVAATGYNNIDIESARAHGVAVTNVAGYTGTAVAQYVFAQILEYYSQTSHHLANTTAGLWQAHHSFCLHGNGSNELAGQTIGIIGYGHLGQSVARIARAFDMNVLIAERHNQQTIRADRLPLEEVLKQSDIVSLHCPLTPDTKHLINKKTLSLMKPSATLINTARGDIINHIDLVNALEQGQIAYAVLDVLEQEPPSESHPVFNTKTHNLKLTGHIAWATQQSQQRLISGIADNIEAFCQGRTLNRIDK
ncbi:D-2-hydroxyacid dehydrogenase [Thalassotalea fusca]